VFIEAVLNNFSTFLDFANAKLLVHPAIGKTVPIGTMQNNITKYQNTNAGTKL